MSEQTAQLLDAFEALPSDDKLGHSPWKSCGGPANCAFDSGPITDEEIGEAGKALFAHLDQEENCSGPPEVRCGYSTSGWRRRPVLFWL